MDSTRNFQRARGYLVKYFTRLILYALKLTKEKYILTLIAMKAKVLYERVCPSDPDTHKFTHSLYHFK